MGMLTGSVDRRLNRAPKKVQWTFDTEVEEVIERKRVRSMDDMDEAALL